MPFIDKDEPCLRAIHNCSNCDREFTGKDSKESLIQHLQNSAKHRKPWVRESCNRCARSFSDTNALIQHLQNNRHHLIDLHHAACTGKFQLVDELMRNGYANLTGDSHAPSSKPQTGYTPMHCAAFGGHDECLKIMLSWPDGDPNVTDPNDGRTPVHLAAWMGHGRCLKLLIRKGGDVRRLDHRGETPMSLAGGSSCLPIMFRHLAAATVRRRRLFPREFTISVEAALKNFSDENFDWTDWELSGGNRSGHSEQFRLGARQKSCQEGEIILGSKGACQVTQFPSNSEELCSEPYEVLARGEVAVQIFNQALREGKACVSRMKLTVIGDVGAGKTSLVRTLSGEDFTEERRETHGIMTSMVERTELDGSWHTADLKRSHVDDILADKVCQGIKDSPGGDQSRNSQGKLLSSSDPGQSFLTQRIVLRRPLSIESPPISETNDTLSEGTSMVPMPSTKCTTASEETPPRDIPVEQIVRRMSGVSLGETENKYAKISIWDFAGHPLYQAMHHVFLNRRSFYLVVFNLVELCNSETTQQALTHIHLWLNSIRVHTPQTTPVFLVGTRRSNVGEKDISRAEEILHNDLVEKFGQQLVKSKETSFLFAVENSLGGSDDGAVELKTAIEEEASRLLLTGEELPVLWLHFEEEILRRREKPDCPSCVTKAYLKEMMKGGYRVVEEEEFQSMLQFYHDSGVIILPEELIGPKTQSSELQDLVVINPQFLVDVMTCLHDIPTHLDVEREHRGQWNTLQEQGRADMNLLEYLWKWFDSPVTEIVGILEASGMLCPISNLADVEDPEDGDEQDESEGSDAVSKYIVPFHLKEKSLKGKWQRLCRKTWNGICNSDKVLMFDFHSFRPPALFQYFIVRTGAKSKSSRGMMPVIAKHMAIFSFADRYFILAEECQKYSQIRISARYKNGEMLHELFSILMSIMTDICQCHFRFLKFSFGPVCPNPRCPGSSSDGKVLPLYPSSDESDEDNDGNSTCDETCAGFPGEVRQHVICLGPAAPTRPLWCNSTPVHEFEEIKQWLKPQNAVSKVPEDSLCHSGPVGVCCLAFVAKAMANDWKFLGRFLDVPETTIDNIETENKSQDERSYQVLISWSRSKASKATAHSLVKAVQDVGNEDAMERFYRHLAEHHVERTATPE